MSDSELKQELPALDVTGEERKRALRHVEEAAKGAVTPQRIAIEVLAEVYCRERQLAAARAEIAKLTLLSDSQLANQERLTEELKHHEETPFFTRNLFENDGVMAGKDFSALTDEDLTNVFEYSETCKCQGCSEIRYILQLRANQERLVGEMRELRQVVKEYRECKFNIPHKKSCKFMAHHDCRCDICIKADALLAKDTPTEPTQEK